MTLSDKERKVCWSSRDAYLQCLDTNHPVPISLSSVPNQKFDPTSDIKASREHTSPCHVLREIMYSTCPQIWAEHFERKRIMERVQKARIEIIEAKQAQLEEKTK